VAFAGEVHAAEVLLLVSFPFAIALLAVVSERERERNSLRNRRSRPNIAWLGAVLVPMAAVAGVAVLLALDLRPLVRLLGEAVRRVALWVLDVLDDVLSFLASLVHLSVHTQTRVTTRSGGTAHFKEVSSRTPAWISVLAIVIGAVLLVVLAVVAFRALRALLRRRRPRRVPVAPLLDEEKDSLFSWSHLLDQLLGVLRRWLGGRAGGAAEMAGTTTRDSDGRGPDSVRSHYRQVLLAARAAGHPRRAFETPLELDSRLEPFADEGAARALSNLTNLYDVVRYGGHLETGEEIARASADADAFVAALQVSGDHDLGDGDLTGEMEPG
jgi:TRAP-type C4-dicarboxylate transport system permease small subunit